MKKNFSLFINALFFIFFITSLQAGPTEDLHKELKSLNHSLGQTQTKLKTLTEKLSQLRTKLKHHQANSDEYSDSEDEEDDTDDD